LSLASSENSGVEERVMKVKVRRNLSPQSDKEALLDGNHRLLVGNIFLLSLESLEALASL